MGDQQVDIGSVGDERGDDAVDDDRSQGRSPLRVLAVLFVLAVVAALVWTSGVLELVTDEEELTSTVEDAGVWGPVVFFVLMVVLVPLNVPGVLFAVPATTLFGTVPGVALAFAGGYVASASGIVGARRLGRPFIEPRLPKRVRRLEQRFSDRGFWAVVVARCFAYLLQPLDWLCGISSLPLRTALLGTFVGLIPPTLVVCLTGGGVLDLVL